MEVYFLGYAIKVWEILAVMGVLLAALEIFVPGFILLPVGVSFLLTSVAAIFLESWLMVLAVLSVNLFLVIWLFNTKLKKEKKVFATNVDSMIGKEVTVTKKIFENEVGEIKLYGDRWNALSASGKEYEIGEKALILKLNGNKVILD